MEEQLPTTSDIKAEIKRRISVLKVKMSHRLLFIKNNQRLIKQLEKDSDKDKKELNQFKNEYLKLLEADLIED